jgi:hypothetical protein
MKLANIATRPHPGEGSAEDPAGLRMQTEEAEAGGDTSPPENYYFKLVSSLKIKTRVKYPNLYSIL